MEVTGLVFTAATAVLQVYKRLEEYKEAKKELGKLVPEFKAHVEHIRSSVAIYFHGKPINGITADVLNRTLEVFQGISDELDSLVTKHESFILPKRFFRTPEHVENVEKCNRKLETIERQVNNLAVVIDENRKLHDKLEEAGESQVRMHEKLDALSDHCIRLVNAVQKHPPSRYDSEISKAVHSIYPALNDPSENRGDVVPVRAREHLDALSKSGISNGNKLELAEMAVKDWKDWKVNPDNIKYVRKRNGDRKRLGKGATADIYLANMKLQDESDEIPVAVKQFDVRFAESRSQFPLFIREVYIQKQARHDCIVRTLGGHWPGPEEVEDANNLEPIIVMEHMTHTLVQAQEEQLLKSLDSKRRIIRDVAEGISHLHSRRIVHRDIKRKNVLVRVVDGQIKGRAKLSNFGFSRKAHMTDGVADPMHSHTGLAGTSPHRAPEATSISARHASKTARDIWSFGVFVCEVLEPDFIHKIDQDFPGIMDAATTVGQNKEKFNLPDKIIERANGISSDDVLRNVAIKCLSLNPKSRPRIEDVLKLIGNTAPSYKFHFMNYMSLESRKKEVVRYVQNSFDAKAQLSKLADAVSILEKEARAESAEGFSAQNVLAYCHYFGIGVEKNENEAMKKYQRGCNVEDPVSNCCMGAIHFSAGSFDDAASLLKKAVAKGCAEARLWLAACYQFGLGATKRNTKEAFKQVEFAAELGNEEAQARLAAYYKMGIGTTPNEGKAIAMRTGLYSRGSALECKRFGLWYKEGLGVPIDEAEAEEFYGMALKRGIVGSRAK